MTTQFLPLPTPKAAQVFPLITWEQFEAIEQSFADVPGVKFVYLDGVLEIMTVSPEHEDVKSTLALLVEAYMRAKQLRFYKRGGPTLGDRSLGFRGEPDESYNLGNKKPQPDLILEVVITSGGVDKLVGDQRLGVPEVWFWEDGGLAVHHLRAGGYERLNYTALLPELPLDLLCRYVTYHDQYDAVTAFLAAIASESQPTA